MTPRGEAGSQEARPPGNGSRTLIGNVTIVRPVHCRRTPIIVLSARGREHDKVTALDLGVGRLPEPNPSACRSCSRGFAWRGVTRAAPTDRDHVRVYLAQLGHKLERDSARPKLLLTEPGVGYRLKEESM